ncbi:MAG: exo-alpha-sialidase, partial [Blastocatellia bacterium]
MQTSKSQYNTERVGSNTACARHSLCAGFVISVRAILLIYLATALTLLSAGAVAQPNAPAAPEKLTATSLAPSCVVLSWVDRARNETGFRVERQQGNGDWQLIAELPANTTRFESVGLAAEQSYRHRVCAFNKTGQTGNGEWAVAEPIKTPVLTTSQPKGRVIIAHSKEVPRTDVGSFLKLRGGELILMFGSFTGVRDTDRSRLGMVVSKDDGQSWSEPRILFQDSEVSFLHPALARMGNGEIGLAYSKLWDGSKAVKVFRHSADEGRMWSDEIPVSDGSYGYMTGASDRLYRLSNNRLVNLVHGKITVTGGTKTSNGRSRLGTDVFVSDDHGRTWRKTTTQTLRVDENPMNYTEHGFWESSLVEHAPGKLLQIGRTANGWAYETRSDDYGSTWTQPTRCPAFRNPLAPVHITMIPGTKEMLLIFNPIVEPKPRNLGGDRWILAAQISSDGGRTWRGYRELEYPGHADWICYPCMYWVGDTLHVAYHYWNGGNTNDRTHDSRYQRLTKAQLLAA